jgi:hypothetical protein
MYIKPEKCWRVEEIGGSAEIVVVVVGEVFAEIVVVVVGEVAKELLMTHVTHTNKRVLVRGPLIFLVHLFCKLNF